MLAWWEGTWWEGIWWEGTHLFGLMLPWWAASLDGEGVCVLWLVVMRMGGVESGLCMKAFKVNDSHELWVDRTSKHAKVNMPSRQQPSLYSLHMPFRDVYDLSLFSFILNKCRKDLFWNFAFETKFV